MGSNRELLKYIGRFNPVISKHMVYGWPVGIEEVKDERTGQVIALQAIVWDVEFEQDQTEPTVSVHSVFEISATDPGGPLRFVRRDMKKYRRDL